MKLSFFAVSVARRVCVSLILAAIFGAIATCARATTLSGGGNYGPYTSHASASYEAVNYNATTDRYDVRVRILTIAPAGSGHYTRATAWLMPNTQAVVTVDSGGNVSAATATITNIAPGTVFTTRLDVSNRQGTTQWWNFPYTGSFTVPTSPARNVSFSQVNDSGRGRWMAVGAVGAGQVQNYEYVPAGGTFKAEVNVQGADVSAYGVHYVDVEAAMAAAGGTLPFDPVSKSILVGDAYMTLVGPAKTKADGVIGDPSPISVVKPAAGAHTGSATRGTLTNPNQISTATPTASGTQGSEVAATNAITDSLSKLTTAVKGISAGGGGGTDMTGVETRLDTISTKLDKPKEVAEKTLEAAAENPTAATILSARTAAVGEAKAAFGSVGSGGASASPYVVPTATQPDAAAFTLVVAGMTIDVNPLTKYATLCAWIKAGFAWALVFWWTYWITNHFRELSIYLANAPQIRGNPVMAGTGAQATSLANAAAWLGIMLAVPVAFSALLASLDISGPSISTLGMGQLMSYNGPGAGVFGQLFAALIPWPTVVMVTVGPVLVKMFDIPLLMGTYTAVRFLVG